MRTLLLLLLSLPLAAMEERIDGQLVRTHNIDTPIELYHSPDGFGIQENGIYHSVYAHNLPAHLRQISPEQLEAFKQAGYFLVKKLSNGEFKLDARVKGLGGGPVLAAAFYGITKVGLYAVGVAGVGGAVVATGGVAGAATGAIAAASTAGASTAVGVTAAGLAGAGASQACAMTSAAAYVAAGGNLAVLSAGVETASMAAFQLGLWIPWF